MHTDDTAEQAQAGGVSFAGVAGARLPGRRQGDAQADGPVELTPPRLHRHHRAERGLVPQELRHQLLWDRLSLEVWGRVKRMDGVG